MNKTILKTTLIVILSLLVLFTTPVSARLDEGSGNNSNTKHARSSITFEYGNNYVARDWYDQAGKKCIPEGTSGKYVSADGNNPCSYTTPPNSNTDKDKMDNIVGSGHLAIDVTYSSKDNKNIISDSSINFAGKNLSSIFKDFSVGEGYFDKKTGKRCEASPTASYDASKCSYKKGETMRYNVDDNGNVVIATKEGRSNMSCTILAGAGNTLEDFNKSMQDCSHAMDQWAQSCGEIIGGSATTCSFGKVKFEGVNGESEVLNEEGLSGDAKQEVAKEEGEAENANGANEEECYDNAGVMGWIMCPVISIMSGFASQIYKDIATKYLEVEANGIFENNGSTYKAWSAFRDVANVAFVVLFLIVIISQLTGIGIDNYGIKRILPRIVIAAILINLSYFICQLVVDIANIAGQAIGGLLSPANLGITFPGGGASGTASYVVSLLVVGAGAAAGAAAMGGATAIVANLSLVMTALGPAGVIMCVLAVLSVVISVLFLWLTLVARQSVVVMLVVLSPLALVCYLLPNTESIFRRYIKAATGVLLLYPICELVINGGQLAGVILANVSDGGSFSLAAMIVQVVPYFLIPGLLKNSMSAIGNLGAKISSVGSTVRGAYNRARKSDFAQDALANTMVGNSQRKIEAIRTLRGRRGGRAISKALGQRQGRAMKRVSDNLRQDLDLESAAMQLGFSQNDDYQQMQIAASRQHALEEDSKIYASRYNNSSDEALKSALSRTMEENNEGSGELEGIINAYMANQNYDGLYDALKSASAAGASSSAMQRAAKAMRDNRNFGELSKRRTSLGEWAKGKIDDSHNIANALYDNIDSFKPKDWAAMNGNERKEAFKALDRLKQAADSGDAQAAARYKKATDSMRAAADNEQLQADMAPSVSAEYRRYAGPAQTSTPTDEQDSGSNTPGETQTPTDEQDSGSNTPGETQTPIAEQDSGSNTPGETQTPIAEQDSGSNTPGETLNIHNANQPAPSRTVTPPSDLSWAERAARNADRTDTGLFMTGGGPKTG